MSKKNKPVEIELKLILPSPDAETAIISKMREHGYAIKEPEKIINVDIYLDTFDWLLLKKKLSLRYRLANGRAMYTLKSMGKMEDGIARRRETEINLPAPVPIPADVPVKQISDIVDGIISPRKLLEHVRISTERRCYQVRSPEGAQIELALDTSSFALRGLHQPRRAQKLQELEAELIKGEVAALKKLGSLLAQSFSYPPSIKSKLEAAIERLKVVIPSKTPPEKLRVQKDNRLDLALRKIIAYQYGRFNEQLPGIKHDIDTEFVHQARVATRRMRSALKLFSDTIPPQISDYLSSELKWLGGLLGAVRDLDVFLLNLPCFQSQVLCFPAGKKKVFDNWIDQHRRAPYKNLLQAIESPRLASLGRRLTHFVEGPLPRNPGARLALITVGEHAPVIIKQKLDAVIRQGQAVMENPDLKQFHLLRIEMKKLRYACEFMAPAYEGELDTFISRTVEIQDCLGEIQDTVFTREFTDFLFADWKGKLVNPRLIFILGEIYQLQAEIARQRQESFGKIWQKFSSAETISQLTDDLE